MSPSFQIKEQILHQLKSMVGLDKIDKSKAIRKIFWPENPWSFQCFCGLSKMHIFGDYTQVTYSSRDILSCFQTKTGLYIKKNSIWEKIYQTDNQPLFQTCKTQGHYLFCYLWAAKGIIVVLDVWNTNARLNKCR